MADLFDSAVILFNQPVLIMQLGKWWANDKAVCSPYIAVETTKEK
jgi:hypothetical protein